MQARVKADYRFDGVTAGTKVYCRDEWRPVVDELAAAVVDSYGFALEFRDDSALDAPVVEPPAPELASAGAVPNVVGDALGETMPADESDSDLEAEADADDLEATEDDEVAAALAGTDEAAAAEVKTLAQNKREAAAKKRAAKRGH